MLADSIRLSWAMAAVVALHALLMLAPPIGLSDAFNYIAYGRLAVEHGLNPYTDTLVSVPHDPAFAYATWPDWTNPYGPLATLAFHPLGLVGVPQALWLVKVVVAAAGVGLAWLVVACARELRRPATPAVVLVALNPVLLVYGVAGAHIDLLLMLIVVAGVLAVLRSRERAAGVAFAAGAAIKATGLLFFPFVLAGVRGRRRELLIGAAAAAAVLFGVGLVLWGPHLLTGVADQRDAVSNRSLPGILSRAFGADEPPAWLQAGAAAGFAFAYVWLRASRVARGHGLAGRRGMGDRGDAARRHLAHAVVRRVAVALRRARRLAPASVGGGRADAVRRARAARSRWADADLLAHERDDGIGRALRVVRERPVAAFLQHDDLGAGKRLALLLGVVQGHERVLAAPEDEGGPVEPAEQLRRRPQHVVVRAVAIEPQHGAPGAAVVVVVHLVDVGGRQRGGPPPSTGPW